MNKFLLLYQQSFSIHFPISDPPFIFTSVVKLVGYLLNMWQNIKLFVRLWMIYLNKHAFPSFTNIYQFSDLFIYGCHTCQHSKLRNRHIPNWTLVSNIPRFSVSAILCQFRRYNKHCNDFGEDGFESFLFHVLKQLGVLSYCFMTAIIQFYDDVSTEVGLGTVGNGGLRHLLCFRASSYRS